MSILSVPLGWQCEGCGVNRNTVEEVHDDCCCGIENNEELVRAINKAYWKKFWRK